MFTRKQNIIWNEDSTGDYTSVAVRKIDDELTKIYQLLTELMHSQQGHKHTGKSDDAPRIFEITRYTEDV